MQVDMHMQVDEPTLEQKQTLPIIIRNRAHNMMRIVRQPENFKLGLQSKYVPFEEHNNIIVAPLSYLFEVCCVFTYIRCHFILEDE